MPWVTFWGKSPACAVELCEECESPSQCDCDCHLEDPPTDPDDYDRSWGY